MKPKISVILPLSNSTTLTELKRCLNSLTNQTAPYNQLIAVIHPHLSPQAKKLLKSTPKTIIYSTKKNKSAARNLGATHATINILFHADVRERLESTTFSQVLKTFNQGYQAVIVKEKVDPDQSGWIVNARRLERQIYLHDPDLNTPQFLTKTLHQKIKGFDPQLDPLDDWSLHLKLKAYKVKIAQLPALINTWEDHSLTQIIPLRFVRGQAFRQLKQKCPQQQFTSFSRRSRTFTQALPFLLKHPLISSSLFILKILEIFVFYLGYWLSPKTILTNPYFDPAIAKRFDTDQLSLLGRYKHRQELKALKQLLPSDKKILEIACGTGRLTHFLINQDYQVTPTDNSPAMLKQYQTKKLPKPIKADARSLPFKTNSFPTVIALRFLWHLANPKDFNLAFKQLTRITQKHLILDLAINDRQTTPPFSWLLKLYTIINPNYTRYTRFLSRQQISKLAKTHQLKISQTIPLDKYPLPGRLLIKFKKL